MRTGRYFSVFLSLFWVGLSSAQAQAIGQVDTAFHLVKDDKILVEAYDDPAVGGGTCYVSRAHTGGLSGAVGVATDKSDASIACRQVGVMAFKGPLPDQEEVFSQRLSVLFKRLHVVRMVDRQRNVLVYLSYSDMLIDGGPKNGISAVPVPAATPLPPRAGNR